MNEAVIALGANLGQPVMALRWAIVQIGLLPQTHLRAVSGVYQSEPVEVLDAQPDYFNAACVVDTLLDPETLLARLLAIERTYGRVRATWHAARTLDLDLICIDARAMASSTLILPHPRAHERAFVLYPMAEIAPQVRLGKWGTVASLLPAVRTQRIRRMCDL